LNKSSRLAPALGVTKLIIVKDMIVTLCCATLSLTWMFNKPTSAYYIQSQQKLSTYDFARRRHIE